MGPGTNGKKAAPKQKNIRTQGEEQKTWGRVLRVEIWSLWGTDKGRHRSKQKIFENNVRILIFLKIPYYHFDQILYLLQYHDDQNALPLRNLYLSGEALMK